MAETISGSTQYPFKWFFRPETPGATPVVQILETPEIAFDQLADVLAEIDGRHWQAVRQILIEAKLKAEAQLRNDEIIKSAQLTAYYNGWVSYSDYCLANLEGLRSGEMNPIGQVAQAMDVQR